MIVYNDKTDLTNVYLGNQEISEVYIGANRVYPSGSTPHDYSQDYFTVRVQTGDFYFKHSNSFPISFSSNGGKTWRTLEAGIYGFVEPPCEVLFKANAIYKITLDLAPENMLNGHMEVYGNILSLVYGDNFGGKTILEHSLSNFFGNNKLLVNAENLILPATTLAEGCYGSMFKGCTSLTTAPELPATTLADRCYSYMFSGCTSLTTAPELPATTLADRCYYGMFQGCSSLTTAPELPATTLADSCYVAMFNGCTSLNEITCLATDISADDCTWVWVYGVASSGTFYKAASMSNWTNGNNGIPNGWTVQDA